MYTQDSRIAKPANIYRSPDYTVANKRSSVGKESQHHTPSFLRSRSFQVKSQRLNPSSLLTASTTALAIASGPTTSSKSTPPLNLRRQLTWVQPEACKDRLPSFSSWPKLNAHKTAPSSDLQLQTQPKPCPASATIQLSTYRIKHQLERINLQGVRKTSSSSDTHQTVLHSCHQSSWTLESSKSSFNSESLDNSSAAAGRSGVGENEVAVEELTDQEVERQMNVEKCLKWMAQLPDKFSGMYILQERAPAVRD
ncbi:hypothetical protein BsWGS_17649 [Bradybaena similaris]